MSDGLSDSKNLALDKQFRRRYFRADTKETDVERMVRCIDDAVIIERNCFIKTKTHGDPFLILQIAFRLFDGRGK